MRQLQKGNHPEFSFCERWGKPIIAFLKKGKLLQPKTTG